MIVSTGDAQMQAFIDRHLAVVAPLLRDANLAAWELQTTSSEAAKERSAQLSAQVAKVYANPHEYAFLKALSPADLQNPLLARQHALLLNSYLGCQMEEQVIEEMIGLEVDIEEQFNTHRAVVDGEPVSDNAIDDILIRSHDSALRREDLACKQNGRG